MNDRRIYSVSDVVRDAKSALEAAYPDLWIAGELANVNCHSSGHCYATLKDAGAQLAIVLFRDDLRRLKFRPEDGLAVLARGRLTLYAPQGRFQFIASHLEPQGKGALQLAFEQLKAKLQAEGLFDASRKRAIPAFPQQVAVITSIDGAALHDIVTIVKRRGAALRVLIYPAKVQGDGAARDLAEAIGRLNRDYPDLDVILLGRGGGSIEDLWAFNEEALARAIAGSAIPIISCVGHETDVTIADFAADLRAETPSAAAEIVTEAAAQASERLEQAVSRLRLGLRYRLDELDQRLDPTRLSQAVQHLWKAREQDLRRLSEKLQLLSPLATLSRGYAIVFRLPERRVIRDAEEIQPADDVEIQFKKGTVHAQVTKRLEPATGRPA